MYDACKYGWIKLNEDEANQAYTPEKLALLIDRSNNIDHLKKALTGAEDMVKSYSSPSFSVGTVAKEGKEQKLQYAVGLYQALYAIAKTTRTTPWFGAERPLMKISENILDGNTKNIESF